MEEKAEMREREAEHIQRYEQLNDALREAERLRRWKPSEAELLQQLFFGKLFLPQVVANLFSCFHHGPSFFTGNLRISQEISGYLRKRSRSCFVSLKEGRECRVEAEA